MLQLLPTGTTGRPTCYCKKTLKTPGLSELVNNCNNNLPVGVNISVNYCYDDGVACKCCSQLLL